MQTAAGVDHHHHGGAAGDKSPCLLLRAVRRHGRQFVGGLPAALGRQGPVAIVAQRPPQRPAFRARQPVGQVRTTRRSTSRSAANSTAAAPGAPRANLPTAGAPRSRRFLPARLPSRTCSRAHSPRCAALGVSAHSEQRHRPACRCHWIGASHNRHSGSACPRAPDQTRQDEQHHGGPPIDHNRGSGRSLGGHRHQHQSVYTRARFGPVGKGRNPIRRPIIMPRVMSPVITRQPPRPAALPTIRTNGHRLQAVEWRVRTRPTTAPSPCQPSIRKRQRDSGVGGAEKSHQIRGTSADSQRGG